MGKSNIGWTDETWNCIRGCTEVSPGCARCYAREQAARIVRMDAARRAANPMCKAGSYDRVVQIRNGKARWTDVVEFDAEKLAEPLKWKRPRRVFVNSMSDLFHESLTNEQIAAVFGVMAACPQHTFQVLTKRAKRMREWFEWVGPVGRALLDRVKQGAMPPFPRKLIEDAALSTLNGIVEAIPTWRDGAWPLLNVWLGVSVENQAAADERIPELLATPAAVRFLSCEPLLGPLDLSAPCPPHARPFLRSDRISWVIAGCESGPGARPCATAWLRSLRDQCAAASVPFFLKQAHPWVWIEGERAPGHRFDDGSGVISAGPGSKRKAGGVIELPYLDGVQHAAFPESTR